MGGKDSTENFVTPLERQEGGNHYKYFKVQPIEYCQLNGLDYCESNVVKYVSRWKYKNGIEDLKKAIHNIQILIQMVEEGKL